jgi:two-component system sensor histidine kinase BaeS
VNTTRAPGGLATRLVAALVLVVLTSVLTAWLVASTVAPALFSAHMRQAGMSGHSEATMHAEEAFRSASVLSLSLALLTALAVSVAVSLVLARRVARTLRPVADAAADVARGHYGVQVPPPGLGAEFEELVTAFNHMARRLDGVEETRRRLLADLAHELRTPVATLTAYLEAVEDGVTVLDADALAVMQAQTGRLTRLAQDVSAVSRAEEGHRTLDRRPTPAATLVTTACAAVADRYTAQGVVLEHVIAQDLPVVQVDVDRMGQVLGNLLDNALRHTPRGGCVTLTADTRDGLLRLQVADTGLGITAEHLPHVFERFYRADAARDRDHGGSGIGLAIVKAYVHGHDGRVTAASDGPGQGTTVTITLPVAALSTH